MSRLPQYLMRLAIRPSGIDEFRISPQNRQKHSTYFMTAILTGAVEVASYLGILIDVKRVEYGESGSSTRTFWGKAKKARPIDHVGALLDLLRQVVSETRCRGVYL